MGAAAEGRFRALSRRQFDAQARPVEFELMDRFNAMPRADDAGTPFGPIHFIEGHGGWWAECPATGYGFWYAELREAIRHWRVDVVEYDAIKGIWKAIPRPAERVTTRDLMHRY